MQLGKLKEKKEKMIKLGGLIDLKPVNEASDSEIKKIIKKKERGGPYTIIARNGQKIVAHSPKSYDKVEDAIKMYHKLNKKHGRRSSVSIEDGYGRTVFMESVNEGGSITEGFATWEVKFARKRINKLELDNKPVRVKARNTVEAIRKAFYAKGGSGKDWVDADVDVLKKL